jgi:HTH-type transcriptional regulator, competence development regulator
MLHKSFGETIRDQRDIKGKLLRQVAAELDMDTALLSKVERGVRKLKKEQVLRLAKIIDLPENQLMTLWLSDKINDLCKDEPTAEDALQLSLKYQVEK